VWVCKNLPDEGISELGVPSTITVDGRKILMVDPSTDHSWQRGQYHRAVARGSTSQSTQLVSDGEVDPRATALWY